MINPLSKIEFTFYTLAHPNVSPELEGVCVAQISDIHLGRWVKAHHVRQLATELNLLSPDIVALTGDYIGYDKRDMERCCAALTELAAPTYAVLGNHDHWAGTELSRNAFQRFGIPLLTNEHTRPTAHPELIIVGVDDHVTKHADVARAFDGVPAETFTLTLNHVPEIADAIAEAGGDLILSGHTHNFQFNIPKVTNRLASTAGARFFAGPYRLEDSFLYVNRGLGSASWPWRIRALPEISVFTLSLGDAPLLELDHAEVRRLEG
ncbi:MAG: metallophosphoesterase [Myxococcota bacterium]